MKVPKFHPGPAYGGLTEQDLAALIRERWHECGHEVEVALVVRCYNKEGPVYDVRSNLVGGLPPVRRDG